MADFNSGELIEAGSSESRNRKRKLSGDGDGGGSKMMKKTDNTARDKVFGNPLLMDRIIGYAMPLDCKRLCHSKRDSKVWEKLRLVNKTFNHAVLHRFRKEFRNISIGFTYDGKMVLNRCWVRRKRFGEFGNFLKNVAKVEFYAIRVNRIDERYMSKIVPRLLNMVEDNNEKLKVFTGLDFFMWPEDEEKCARIAVRCREYGPLQLNVLLNAFREQTHHYDTLIVSEYLLEKIAIQCAESAVDKDDCLARMAAIITLNITCRRLVFKLYEKPNGRRHKCFNEYIPIHPLPREIIDEMIRKWNVKSVKLEFYTEGIKTIDSSCWSKFGYFTEFSFDQPYEDMRPSNYRLNLVEVDLENASLMMRAIADEMCRRKINISCENLFANVRRVFPTEEMNVRFSMTFEYCCMRPGRTTEMVKNIMNSVWRDNPKDLKMKIDIFSCLDPAFNSHQIPSHFHNNHLDVRMTVDDCRVEEFGEGRYSKNFELRRARGKRYRIVDEMNKCRIDFGVFEKVKTFSAVDERKRKRREGREKSEWVSTQFGHS